MKNKLKINLLFTFYLIIFGLSIQPVMASMFDTPVAMITSVEGKVYFENTTNRQVDFGTDIFIGDILKTSANSSLSLTFYNGCRQETIDQHSLVQVGSSQSVLRSGKFKQVEVLDCEIPKAVLQQADSHLKAGLVVRGVDTDTNESLGIPSPLASSDITPVVSKNDFQLKAWTNYGKQPVYRVGEPILIHFLTDKDAYILISYYASNGALYKLTPELSLNENKIIAKKLYSLGNSHTGLIAGLPTGIDTIHILASDKPIAIASISDKGDDYYHAVKQYVNNNQQQLFSEQQIKLTISQ